jgi:glycosyltransferase involved in cell wall biosynthesis
MRIVQVCPWFEPYVGGVETHVATLSSELVRRGHDVTVLTSRADRDLREREDLHGIHVRRVKTRAVWFRTPIAPATKAVLGSMDADVVHAHSPPPLTSYYAAKASSRRRLPFVITYHCDVEVPSVFGPLVEAVYRNTLEYSTIRRANRIIVTTATYAATSRAVWRYNPAVIPNAVDPQRYRPENDGSAARARHGIREGESVVLFVGRMVLQKGIENLVEAARSVAYAKFLLVGGGPEIDSLRRLAARLGVAERVIFTGQVSQEDLPSYFAACDVFVLPSVSRLEAFGIVALEAMASGKPVVVSDIPGVREVITDGKEGLLADPVDPEDLGGKIRILLADDRKRSVMGRAGRETVERNFGVETVVDRIEALYRDLAANRRSL